MVAVVAGQVDADRVQLADAAVADQLAGEAGVVAGALVAAGLQDAVVLAARPRTIARPSATELASGFSQ